MFIRKVMPLAMLCALGLVGASSASATTELSCGTIHTACPANTIIGSNTIDGHATLTSAIGNVTCSESSWMGDVPSSTTVAGSLSGTLTGLNFGTTTPASSAGECSGTGFAASITNCETGSISKAITAHGSTTTTGLITIPSGLVVTCKDASENTVCTFTTTATVTGNASATLSGSTITSNTLSFSTTAVQGSFPCPSSGNSFSVDFTNIRTGSGTNGSLVAIGT